VFEFPVGFHYIFLVKQETVIKCKPAVFSMQNQPNVLLVAYNYMNYAKQYITWLFVSQQHNGMQSKND
jgi:hypothetical protein